MKPTFDVFRCEPFGARRNPAWAIAVHGGAGRGQAGPASEQGCRAAVAAGAAALKSGATALDAAEAAVRALENDPLFNAGIGAALNESGLIELDAAIMDGATLRVGGVCALPPFRNPVSIARAVLESGVHSLYAGEGAAMFAVAAGFSPASAEELTTPRAREAWNALRTTAHPHEESADATAVHGGAGQSCDTVGAVVRDAEGRCAAATSTGGIVGKRPGRVGDSPLPGAGTYADEHGAASATGHGEFILRACLARRAIEVLQGGGDSELAAGSALEFLLSRLQSRAGIIVVDSLGRLGIARSTERMPWAACSGSLSEIASGC